MELKLQFLEGIPKEEGYYLVELEENVRNGSKMDMFYDVDFCRETYTNHGWGMEWVLWYPHNVKRWAKIPKI